MAIVAIGAELDAAPGLATGCLTRRDESFLATGRAQVYASGTALHAAAFAYDAAIARKSGW